MIDLAGEQIRIGQASMENSHLMAVLYSQLHCMPTDERRPPMNNSRTTPTLGIAGARPIRRRPNSR
jgi:hypothetical protein